MIGSFNLSNVYCGNETTNESNYSNNDAIYLTHDYNLTALERLSRRSQKYGSTAGNHFFHISL